ncbi:MAG: hypothetical protein WC307_05460 [Candidatus Nanoarchaeia archaeon]|jgi:hypothetical protein
MMDELKSKKEQLSGLIEQIITHPELANMYQGPIKAAELFIDYFNELLNKDYLSDLNGVNFDSVSNLISFIESISKVIPDRVLTPSLELFVSAMNQQSVDSSNNVIKEINNLVNQQESINKRLNNLEGIIKVNLDALGSQVEWLIKKVDNIKNPYDEKPESELLSLKDGQSVKPIVEPVPKLVVESLTYDKSLINEVQAFCLLFDAKKKINGSSINNELKQGIVDYLFKNGFVSCARGGKQLTDPEAIYSYVNENYNYEFKTLAELEQEVHEFMRNNKTATIHVNRAFNEFDKAIIKYCIDSFRPSSLTLEKKIIESGSGLVKPAEEIKSIDGVVYPGSFFEFFNNNPSYNKINDYGRSLSKADQLLFKSFIDKLKNDGIITKNCGEVIIDSELFRREYSNAIKS